MSKLTYSEAEIEQIAKDTYETVLPGFDWNAIKPDSIFDREFFIRWTRTVLSVAKDLD
jgi:hypothetical protein